MKAGIHPEYKVTAIACVCGNVIHTRSTRENIKVGVCSRCHPFYTGKSKFIDTAGMVEKFKKKYGEEIKLAKPPKKVVKAAVAPQPKAEKAPKAEKKPKAEKPVKPAAETAAKAAAETPTKTAAEIPTQAAPETKSEGK